MLKPPPSKVFAPPANSLTYSQEAITMAALERNFSLQVPSSTENLALIREFVTSVGRQASLDEREIGKLELAVDEACANVIEHAYGHDSTKEVTVRAIFDPGMVKQETLDQLIHERQSGGLGLRLIKNLMDEVHYEIVPGEKNELHMTKRIKK
jgi:serine/threonine-protein kinase RsbW